jgi:hypothetical protein
MLGFVERARKVGNLRNRETERGGERKKRSANKLVKMKIQKKTKKKKLRREKNVQTEEIK